MKTHELARRLLAGPDVPAVIPTYDDQDREQHVEVKTCGALAKRDRWFDTNSSPRHSPAVELSLADE